MKNFGFELEMNIFFFLLRFLETLCEVIKTTVIKWGRATHINHPNLIREMFKLIYNQYDGIGEVNNRRYRIEISISFI